MHVRRQGASGAAAVARCEGKKKEEAAEKKKEEAAEEVEQVNPMSGESTLPDPDDEAEIEKALTVRPLGRRLALRSTVLLPCPAHLSHSTQLQRCRCPHALIPGARVGGGRSARASMGCGKVHAGRSSWRPTSAS